MTDGQKPEVEVVTGAPGGVGRAIAHAFAKRGAHIGLLARGERGLDDARREVEGSHLGTVYGTMAALRRMTACDSGTIVQVGPDHPQPVPPIHQPEIPAEAVYWAGGRSDRASVTQLTE